MNTNKKAGRPLVNIAWPNTPFTIKQLHDSMGISKVTLYQKAVQALKDNVLTIVGKETVKRGCPPSIFQRAQQVQTGVATSVNEAAPVV